VVRQQVIESRLGVGLNPNEHIGEIFLRVDFVCDAGGDDSLKDGEIFTGVVVAHE